MSDRAEVAGGGPLEADQALWAQLSRATVRILDSGKEVLGSGFFIQPGSVLTAAHVVAGATRPPLSIELHDGRKCHIVNTLEMLPRHRLPGQRIWPFPDVAVLSVQDEWLDQTVPFVEMSDQFPAGEVLICGVTAGLAGGMAADNARLRFEATRTDGDTTLLKLSGNSLEPGMSGGPVLDPVSGRVVGMVKADREDGAFAIAGASIAAALPAHWASHREAHRSDSRWRMEASKSRYAPIGPALVGQYLEALTTEYRRSALLPPGLDRDQVSQPTRVRPRRSIGTEIEAGGQQSHDESADSASGEAFLWDPLRSPWAAVSIVAGPGMGKSWLLTNHAVTIGNASLDRVRGKPEAHVDVDLPVVVAAAAFARRLDPDPDLPQATAALSVTIVRTLGQGLDSSRLMSLLGLALEDRRVVLCVDGMDEVPDDLRERLLAALATLQPLVSKLVVSGRESARPTLERVFGGGEYEEFSIAGFAPGDVRRFVRSWYRDDPELIAKVEGILRSSPGLRTLMHVPLLLSFVCRLAAEGRSLTSTRSGLYRAVAHSVLKGSWREPEPVPTDPVERLRLLADAVGPLAAPWRSRPDEFSEHQVELALRSQPDYEVIKDAALRRWRAAQATIDRGDGQQPPNPVIWEFLHDGLLISTQGPQGEQLLRFSHLVFGELCVGMWLAKLGDKEQAEQIERHRWFDRHWEDIIPIACGVADDPGALLDRLSVDGEDPWLVQAQLLANCMVEASTAADREQVEGLVTTLVQRLGMGPASDAPGARGALATLVASRVEHADRRLVEALQNRELRAPHKGFAMRLLCQVGEAYAVSKCKEIVGDPDVPEGEREEAAIALCRSGDPSAVQSVIESFSRQSGTYQHLAVALTRGETSSEAALELVRRRDVDQVLRVHVAIEQLQVNGIETAAQELLADPQVGLTSEVRLTVALLRAGQQVDSARANALVGNPNLTRELRVELVHTLLLRSEFAALPVAADLVIDGDIHHARRRRLAQTMFSVGPDGARTLYRSATRSNYKPEARLQALMVLIERKHVGGCDAAAAIIADGEAERWAAAHLLGMLLAYVPNTVDQEVVAGMLTDRDLSERWSSAWEELAVRALRWGGSELRDRIADRIKKRVEAVDQEPTDLAEIDISVLLSRLATYGGNGLDLLVDIARDGSATVDARVNAAMSAALGDVTRVADLESVLDDPELVEPVQRRLAVAFAMLGAPQMLTRMLAMLPASEPAYVALRSILQSESIGPDTVAEGIRRGREAVRALCQADPIAWDLDFAELGAGVRFDVASDTQRQHLEAWATNEIRERTYARLVSLLLPSERVALHRVGGFVDSQTTRDWLATWVAAYRDVAHAEAKQLQDRLDAKLEEPPNMDDPASISTFELVSQAARVLGEWWKAVRGEDWTAAFGILVGHQGLFASPLMANTNLLVDSFDRMWPDSHARAFLLSLVGQPDGIGRVHRLLTDYGCALNEARLHRDSGRFPVALGAASIAVLRWPNDAAGFFYAAEALLALGESEDAKRLLAESADRASPKQAREGRRTLRELGERLEIAPELVEEMRDILGNVLEQLGLDPDVAEDDGSAENEHGDSPEEAAADGEEGDKPDEDAL